MKQPELVPTILVMNDEYFLPFCLEAAVPYFNRFVIYDVGSTDATVDVINEFRSAYKQDKDILVRHLPFVDPVVQGTFRNSLIAEARSDWYFILDADEVYTNEGYRALINSMDLMKRAYEEDGALYGMVPRVEVCKDLKSAYGQDLGTTHHRIYHRTAIFDGPHPGEWPHYNLKGRDIWLSKDAVCYHFHNADRSRNDDNVPRRVARRSKKTYHPGSAEPFDLFKTLPLLRRPIGDFPVNPALKAMQDAC
jgi:glycosyltransferase involved in cell wall biosynthesis